MIPIDQFSAARVDTNMKGFGILLELRQGPILIDADGTCCMVVPLTGDIEFRHFRLPQGSPLRGLFFDEIQFVVDPSSRFNTHQMKCRGALTFENDKLCLITSPLDDSFNDDVSFPLPLDVGSHDGVPVGFSKWSVGKMVGGEYHELWAFKGEPKKL